MERTTTHRWIEILEHVAHWDTPTSLRQSTSSKKGIKILVQLQIGMLFGDEQES